MPTSHLPSRTRDDHLLLEFDVMRIPRVNTTDRINATCGGSKEAGKDKRRTKRRTIAKEYL
jgi:hypothetical protein